MTMCANKGDIALVNFDTFIENSKLSKNLFQFKQNCCKYKTKSQTLKS